MPDITTPTTIDDEDDYWPVTCNICDGLHSVCPIESPAPDYYAAELAAGR